VVGIGGRGLAPIAAAAQSLGARVDGCDPRGFASSLALLERQGITVRAHQDPGHLINVDAVVATASANRDSPEIAAARVAGQLHRRMDLVAAVMTERPGVGVTGSHGKGTVVALAAGAAASAGLDPLCAIGADAPALGGPFRAGAGPSFVEVDDSDLAAHFTVADVAVVTNLDYDHPHLPVTLAEAIDSVGAFVENARRAVVMGPSPRQDALARRAKVPVWRIGHDVRARAITTSGGVTHVRIYGPDGEREDAHVRLIGPKTATNAALAYAALRALGVESGAAAEGLGVVDRLWRRMEPRGIHGGVWVYDDFGGKHPANVRAGLAALRRHHPEARLIAVFEPVFATTVRKWGWRYARALASADVILVTPTFDDHPEYPRDADPTLDAWFESCGRHASQVSSVADAASASADIARPGDVIVGFFQITRSGEDFASAVIEELGAAAPPH
jgi:UDP-N-acetylmuramate--alanine ligase